MAQFHDWCLSVDEPVGNHFHRVMTAQVGLLPMGIQATAGLVPGHYASRAHWLASENQPRPR
jgi:uncharacterized cupin superfamily protein